VFSAGGGGGGTLWGAGVNTKGDRRGTCNQFPGWVPNGGGGHGGTVNRSRKGGGGGGGVSPGRGPSGGGGGHALSQPRWFRRGTGRGGGLDRGFFVSPGGPGISQTSFNGPGIIEGGGGGGGGGRYLTTRAGTFSIRAKKTEG